VAATATTVVVAVPVAPAVTSVTKNYSTVSGSSPAADSKKESKASLLAPAADVAAICAKHERLRVMRSAPHLTTLHTLIRDRNTSQSNFVFYADQILRLLCEEAVSGLPYKEKVVMTPTELPFKGLELATPVCAVSIMRAGESMEAALRCVLREVAIGKILIQRVESQPDKPARLYYTKLPHNIAQCSVLLLDPMLATGGSARAACKVLCEAGVAEDRIYFVNLISCPEGIQALFAAYPRITVITGMIDYGLNQHMYILPGIGDFGDRYFGTV